MGENMDNEYYYETGDSYYDSAYDITISKARALQELENHGITCIQEFFDDVGDREEYPAQKVLDWLGY